MVLQVGAVLALVVVIALAEVVGGQVETRRSVLTRIGLAVIDVQLDMRQGEGGGMGYKINKYKYQQVMEESDIQHFWRLRKGSAAHSILPTGPARKRRTKRPEEGKQIKRQIFQKAARSARVRKRQNKAKME